MNANRKASALKKYKPLFENGEDIIEALKADERIYTESEISEIIEALGDPDQQNPDAKGKEKGQILKDKKKNGKADSSKHYEEWSVEIKGKKAEKLKLIRPVVKISEDEAEILNTGILEGSNTHAKMYFKAE